MKTVYCVKCITGWSIGYAYQLGKYTFDTYEEAKSAASEAMKENVGTPAEHVFFYFVTENRV